MTGFFIYGTILPREWYISKQMESGLDMGIMLNKLNKIFNNETNDIIIHFINTRNGDELILGKILPTEKNEHISIIKVPEMSEKNKWEVESAMNDYFNLDYVNMEYNLYFITNN